RLSPHEGFSVFRSADRFALTEQSVPATPGYVFAGNFLPGLQVGHPGFRIHIGIDERQRYLQRVRVDELVSFFNAGIKALWKTEGVDPRSLIKADSGDEKRVTLPCADGVSVPGRAEIVDRLIRWDCSSVEPDFTRPSFFLPELNHPVRQHDHFVVIV